MLLDIGHVICFVSLRTNSSQRAQMSLYITLHHLTSDGLSSSVQFPVHRQEEVTNPEQRAYLVVGPHSFALLLTQ